MVWNVKLNFPPAEIVPELNWPPSALAVCAIVSLFDQVTVVPAAIVTGFGANAELPRLWAPIGIPTVAADPE